MSFVTTNVTICVSLELRRSWTRTSKVFDLIFVELFDRHLRQYSGAFIFSGFVKRAGIIARRQANRCEFVFIEFVFLELNVRRWIPYERPKYCDSKSKLKGHSGLDTCPYGVFVQYKSVMYYAAERSTNFGGCQLGPSNMLERLHW